MSDYPVWTLLIEDNPADARLIWEMLAGSDFRLHIAEDLSGGLQQIQETNYDVILLDLSLPDSSGMETVLKARANLPRTAIVVLTGLDDPMAGILAVQHGAQDYLVKGEVDSKLLRRAIHYAIERHHQSQDLAALEERQRLARNLHDSVSQTLFTCSVLAESALRKWDKDPQRAHELLTEVHQVTLTALYEMRILLLELNPDALTRVNLKQLFEQYLIPIQSRRGYTLKIQIDEIPDLPAKVQIALYRITQEALNNIEKHAMARHVSISVQNHPDDLKLIIRDDGRGFDPNKISPSSLGLSIMREYAEEINASLQIRSPIGEGTQIKVIWQKSSEWRGQQDERPRTNQSSHC